MLIRKDSPKKVNDPSTEMQGHSILPKECPILLLLGHTDIPIPISLMNPFSCTSLACMNLSLQTSKDKDKA
jgi:hypothetical protein